ncbi:10130_t:CDS:1 [Paraglomus brasilianum]|uniref:10130_t:CDS:1 n=1 Tax=Paraglomus brasilianum TaxID=144538 RepID=A0A9N9B6F2_9GLOM|nr:10130_t:CDS:1 [Paraglomus brasilianum]
MDISSELTSYFNDTNYEKWSCMDCLEYLKEVCAHLTSNDRDEIFQNYKAQLPSMSSRSSM